MIKKVRVEALKSIRELTLECSNLNLLVGTNSSGKSSFLQAILLTAQNRLDGSGLNGKYVSLGEFREVRNFNSSNQPIKIELWQDDNAAKSFWINFFEKNDSDESVCQILASHNTVDNVLSKEFSKYNTLKFDYPDFFLSYNNFYYLSFDRKGVSDIYAKNLLIEEDFGVYGEYALSYLLENQDKPISNKLLKEDEGYTKSLLDQVNYWLKYVTGTIVSVEDIKSTNYLKVTYSNNPTATSGGKYCRPANIGTGISYLISIIITCLGSVEDSVIVIENPEIHLHPKAQSKLCEFLYFISCSNRQLFIETHSDHIFNGIRAGVATREIKPQDISVTFFALNDSFETQCNPISFGEFGKIEGKNEDMDIRDLFDQFEIDLDKMLGINSETR